MQLYSLVDVRSISVTLFWFDRKTNLTLSVPFYRNIKDGQDRFFYADFTSYRGGYRMRLDLDWWIYVRNTQDDYKSEFRLNNQNIYQFVQSFKTVKSWLVDHPNNEPLFTIDKDKKIKVNNPYGSVMIVNDFGDSLELVPSVKTNDTGTEYAAGISMFINNQPDETFIDISKFLNFVYMIETINPWNMSMEMINFAMIRTNDKQDLEDRGGITGSGRAIPLAQKFLDYTGAKERVSKK